MPETTTNGGSQPLYSRVRKRLTSVSPFSLVLLGFIGFLGDLFPALEILQLFHVFWLFAFWPVVSLLVSSLQRSLGYSTDSAGPRDWLEMDDGWRAQFAFLLGLPLSVLNPLMFRQDAMQLVGSIVAVIRNRGSLPGPETFTQSTKYRLPVNGTWTVVNGSPLKEYSHSWFPATQRYAYDFVITDDAGRTHPANTDTKVENYYCYDQPVLAPADGVVVDVHDGDPELSWAGGFSHPLKHSVTGNSVVIRHARDEYSNLVHLVPGSITVEPGEHVEKGEQVGRCGHSGNSSEPHLHFQLQDHPTFEVAAGLPIRFDTLDIDTPGVDVGKETNWSRLNEELGSYIHVGQRVSQPSDRKLSLDETVDGHEARETLYQLRGIRTVGEVSKGLSIGGFLTVLIGFVVSPLMTVTLLLTGISGLALAYQVARQLLDGAHRHLESFATTGGLVLATVLVGILASSNIFSISSSSTVGAGMFMIGFLLYIVVWEFERRTLFQDQAPPSNATD